MSQCLDGQSVPSGIPGEGAVGKSQDGDDHEEDEDAADPGEDVSTLKTEKQNFQTTETQEADADTLSSFFFFDPENNHLLET